MVPARGGLAVVAALVLSACGSLTTTDVADPECGFPADTPLAFAGQASLQDLDLHASLDDEGMVYISRDPIVPAVVSGDVAVAPARLYCIVYADSAGLRTQVGPLPDGWVLPGRAGG